MLQLNVYCGRQEVVSCGQEVVSCAEGHTVEPLKLDDLIV